MEEIELYKKFSKNMGYGNDRLRIWGEGNYGNIEGSGGEVSVAQVIGMRDVIKEINPKNILEIGFNRGASSLCWLLFSQANVISIDIDGSLSSEEYLKNCFWHRFTFYRINSLFLPSIFSLFNRKFDFAFIDGEHDTMHVRNDILQCLHLNIKYLLLDDYNNTAHSKHIKEAIKTFSYNYKIIKEIEICQGQVLLELIT